MKNFGCNSKSGFTLTELLLVVIIIGIATALTLPLFVRTMEKAKVGEATSNLNLIRMAEREYYLENGTYIPITGITDADWANSNLNIDNPNGPTGRCFDYTVSSTDVSSNFTAKATRKNNAPSGYQGNEYTIKKDGVISGPLI